MSADADPPIEARIETIYRSESRRVLATLIRLLGDFDRAEEALADALVAALEQWPESGVPEKPGDWLMATAKHRAIDALRRRKLLERKHVELAYELEHQIERLREVSGIGAKTEVRGILTQVNE